MKSIRYLIVVFLPLLPVNTQAGDFDGSRLLICAPVKTMDCVRGDDCLTGLPEDVGAPAFMRLDFAKKTVIGPKVTSPIMLMEKTGDQILLQGREVNFGWTIALDSENGEMAVTLADRNGVYVLFGSCTPL
jgi:hypothetical protein